MSRKLFTPRLFFHCAFWLGTCLAVGNALAAPVTVQVVDKDGHPAADAVVVLVPANHAAQPRQALPKEITIVQHNMQFIPAVAIVPLGGKVKFVNDDPWDHHVRGSAAGAAQFVKDNEGGFSMRLEGKSKGKPASFAEVTLDKPGSVGATLLGCFIHGSMRGNLYVSDSPWAAKTGADGTARFDDVPDGALQVKVWQADQLIDLPPQQAYVGNAPVTLKMQLQVTPRKVRGMPYTSY